MKPGLIIFIKLKFESIPHGHWKLLAELLLDLPFFNISKVGTTDSTEELKGGSKGLAKVLKDNSILNLYPEEESLENVVVLFLDPESMDITITTNSLENIDLEHIETYLKAFVETFQAKKLIGLNVHVEASGDQLDYPRIRPPRIREILGNDSLFQIIDKRFIVLSHNDHLNADVIDDLAVKAGEASWVRQEEKDGFLFLAWGNSLLLEEVNEKLAMREDFIAHIPAPLQWDFNEKGDRNIINVELLEKLPEKEFFTYFEEDWEYAFKLAVPEDGKINAEVAEQLKSAASLKALADGRGFDEILLVVAGRDHVHAISDQAKELGVYKVLYIDDGLDLWDVHPKGNWKN